MEWESLNNLDLGEHFKWGVQAAMAHPITSCIYPLYKIRSMDRPMGYLLELPHRGFFS